MRYSKGKTTVKDLIQKLQALGKEHLDKPVISFGTWGLERPDHFIVPAKNYYEEYNGCIILRSAECYLSRPPIHTYYCTKCIYYKAIASFETIPEAKVVYPDLPEEYIK